MSRIRKKMIRIGMRMVRMIDVLDELIDKGAEKMSEVIVKLTSDRIRVKGGEYVQDLVRCRECKYWLSDKPIKNKWFQNGEIDQCKWRTDESPNADDFCSYGVRKGADDE